jgi:hypothetical protein
MVVEREGYRNFGSGQPQRRNDAEMATNYYSRRYFSPALQPQDPWGRPQPAGFPPSFGEKRTTGSANARAVWGY